MKRRCIDCGKRFKKKDMKYYSSYFLLEGNWICKGCAKKK